jgi:hypothetical protein
MDFNMFYLLDLLFIVLANYSHQDDFTFHANLAIGYN